MKNYIEMNLKYKLYCAIWILLAIMAFVKSMIWLGFVFIFLTMLLLLSKTAWYAGLKKQKWIYTPIVVIAVLVMAISLRLFVFEIYRIPSGSMEKTLIKGDIILLNKLVLGPRLPRSPYEIPWINIPYYLNAEDNNETKKLTWGFHKLSGWRGVQRGDILVFNPPYNYHQTWIKRCVALPGDTIKVKNNEVFINGEPKDPLSQGKENYRLFYNSDSLIKANLDLLGINYKRLVGDTVDVKLSALQVIQLGAKKAYHHFINLDTDSKLNKNTHKKKGNAYFNKFLIPYRGMEIALTPDNKKKYKKILTRHEGLIWDKEAKEYKQDGNIVKSHVFKYDYYFMMGDNRTGSTDSRSWSALPDKLIIGKATNIIWNQGETGVIGWGRIGSIL